MLLLTLSLALAQDETEDTPPEEAPTEEAPTAEAPEPEPEPEAEEAFEAPPPKEKKVRSVGLAERPQGFGIGLILGDPTGISGGWRPDDTKLVDGALAWSIPNSSFEVHADYQHTLIEIRDPNAERIAFPIALGGGVKFASSTSQGKGSAIAALRVPIMISVVPDEVPIDGFLEVVPTLDVYPATKFGADAGIGARVWFD